MIKKEEFGGWIPFERCRTEEYYNPEQYNILKVNSGRAAIWAALKQIKPKRVFVPHYTSNSIYKVINDLGISMIKYFIDEQFYPIDIHPLDTDCLIIVNYFGCTELQVANIIDKCKTTNIILDHAHAFFNPPRMGVYTVYSHRKFFGVPDGAYLINNTQNGVETDTNELPKDVSCARMAYLFNPIDLTTDSAYSDFKKNELYLTDNYKRMSDLSEYLIRGIDYLSVLNRRTENYLFIHERFRHINKLALPEKAVPYIYPLLTEQNLIDVKKRFINSGYYASTLWQQHLEPEYRNTFEQKMASQCLFIPIDQRYDSVKLSRLCELICSEIGGDFNE